MQRKERERITEFAKNTLTGFTKEHGAFFKGCFWEKEKSLFFLVNTRVNGILGKSPKMNLGRKNCVFGKNFCFWERFWEVLEV